MQTTTQDNTVTFRVRAFTNRSLAYLKRVERPASDWFSATTHHPASPGLYMVRAKPLPNDSMYQVWFAYWNGTRWTLNEAPNIIYRYAYMGRMEWCGLSSPWSL